MKPRLERLEERLALSGFGPEDGAYIENASVVGFNYGVRVQPGDDKIVVATNVGTSVGLTRFDSAGNPDLAYGNAGTVNLPKGGGYGVNVALQADGKAVAGMGTPPCSGTYCGTFTIARVNTDGLLDTSFGSGGSSTVSIPNGTTGQVGDSAIGVQSTGKIVVAGNEGTFAALARFTASGAVDSGSGGFGDTVTVKNKGKTTTQNTGSTVTSFGSGTSVINSLAIQSDDKIVAVGTLEINYGGTQLVVARYTASGALDKTFNGKGYALVGSATGYTEGSGVAIQPDGKIIVSGFSSDSSSAGDGLIARYNANGTLDSTFTDGVHTGYVLVHPDAAGFPTVAFAHSVAVQSDGKIVTAGMAGFTGYDPPHSILAARFNPNGSPDTTFGTGGYKVGSAQPNTGFHDLRASGMALESDGSIIVSGTDFWGTTGGTQHPMLMRFSGGSATSASTTSGVTTTASATDTALMLLLTDDSLMTNKRK